VDNLKKVKFKKDGTYKVQVSGMLTVKGISKPVNTLAMIVVAGETVNANTSFTIKLADYGISGQPVDAGKVSKEPKINVSASF
jgi:polyisoprenoid-binding protein YceI